MYVSALLPGIGLVEYPACVPCAVDDAFCGAIEREVMEV